MRNIKNQKGFSLIELLVVVVIIGVVAALAIPAYQRGILAAEIRSAQTTLKAMSSSQAMFFSQNQRFARIGELNAINSNNLGSYDSGTQSLTRNKFTFLLVSDEAKLNEGYTITASRNAAGLLWQFELTNTGIMRVYPTAAEY